MKLRDIFNRLKALAEGIASVKTQVAAVDAVKQFLKSLGFTYLNNGCYSIAYASEKWGGVVVKFSPDEIGVQYPDLETWPALRKVWLKPLFRSEFVCIQPLADTSALWEAQNAVYEALTAQGVNPDNFDLHEGNVGHYRGRAVAFDA